MGPSTEYFFTAQNLSVMVWLYIMILTKRKREQHIIKKQLQQVVWLNFYWFIYFKIRDGIGICIWLVLKSYHHVFVCLTALRNIKVMTIGESGDINRPVNLEPRFYALLFLSFSFSLLFDLSPPSSLSPLPSAKDHGLRLGSANSHTGMAANHLASWGPPLDKQNHIICEIQRQDSETTQVAVKWPFATCRLYLV